MNETKITNKTKPCNIQLVSGSSLIQKLFTIDELKRIFECGRNYQLTGENNFDELTGSIGKEFIMSNMEFIKTNSNKLKVAFIRDVLDRHFRDEISFTRMVELINEEVSKEHEPKLKYTCEICGRNTFDAPTPHNCKGGFRKRGFKWSSNYR